MRADGQKSKVVAVALGLRSARDGVAGWQDEYGGAFVSRSVYGEWEMFRCLDEYVLCKTRRMRDSDEGL